MKKLLAIFCLASIVLTGCSSGSKVKITPAVNEQTSNIDNVGKSSDYSEEIIIKITPPGMQPPAEPDQGAPLPPSKLKPLKKNSDLQAYGRGPMFYQAAVYAVSSSMLAGTDTAEKEETVNAKGATSKLKTEQNRKIKVNGVEIEGADPNSAVEVHINKKGINNPERIKEIRSGKATGSGYEASGDKVNTDFNGAAGDVDIGEGTSSGGFLESSSKLLSSPKNLSYLILALLFTGGGVFFLVYPPLRNFKLGVALIAVGVTVAAVGVMVDKYPWLLAIMGVIGLVALCLIVWELVKKNKTIAQVEEQHDTVKTVLTKVVTAVENLDPTNQVAVKAAIKEEANGSGNIVKDTITEIKRSI